MRLGALTSSRAMRRTVLALHGYRTCRGTRRRMSPGFAGHEAGRH